MVFAEEEEENVHKLYLTFSYVYLSKNSTVRPQAVEVQPNESVKTKV
jgi:hypothetical protein